MKVVGLNPLRYGDLYMATVGVRCFKRIYPNAHFTFVINADYRECAPLFLDHPDIDRIHILDRDKDGFNEVDWDWIRIQNFDHIFDPMQDHDRPDWYLFRHQALEAAYMHRIPIDGDDGKIVLNKWFKETDGLKNYVALAPFPAWYQGSANRKSFTMEQAEGIVKYLKVKGYNVLQVGGPNEPQLSNVLKINSDYFNSVKNILGCRAFIGSDSGLTWCLSGYDFPVLGLYPSDMHGGPNYVKNIQPINPNALYLDANTMKDIKIEDIYKAIDKLLN